MIEDLDLSLADFIDKYFGYIPEPWEVRACIKAIIFGVVNS